MEDTVTSPSLTIEGVLQLSVDQWKQQLLQRGIDPTGRPKPRLQLELLQVLKLEIVLPETKVSSVEDFVAKGTVAD